MKPVPYLNALRALEASVRLGSFRSAAAELGVTEKTIKAHRARVMKKMEATSLAHLVRMAGRVGL